MMVQHTMPVMVYHTVLLVIIHNSNNNMVVVVISDMRISIKVPVMVKVLLVVAREVQPENIIAVIIDITVITLLKQEILVVLVIKLKQCLSKSILYRVDQEVLAYNEYFLFKTTDWPTFIKCIGP